MEKLKRMMELSGFGLAGKLTLPTCGMVCVGREPGTQVQLERV